MIRFLVLSLVLLVGAIVLSGALLEDTGFVVIGVRGQVVRTSLVFFVVLTVLLMMLAWWTIKLLVRFWRAPRDLQNWSQRRREHKAARALSEGFLAMVQGDWGTAERSLSNGARNANEPALHYLGAARAAQAQHATDRQTVYLQLAREQSESAELPVVLTQMETALHEHRLDDARRLLQRLQEIDSRHAQVARMELAYHRARRDWAVLLELTPKARKQRLLGEDQLDAIEHEALDGLMLEAEERHDPLAIKAAWDRVPKARRHQPEIIARHVRALAAAGEHDKAHNILLHALRRNWDADLVRLFGAVHTKDTLGQLRTAEGWLQQHGDESALLMALGQLSLSNGLWGKARSYLETLIDRSPSPEAWRLLAEAQEQLGDRDAALRCHRQGLLLATGSTTTRLLPHTT